MEKKKTKKCISLSLQSLLRLFLPWFVSVFTVMLILDHETFSYSLQSRERLFMPEKLMCF